MSLPDAAPLALIPSSTSTALALPCPTPADEDPRLVYLGGLSTAKSRRSMARALELVAEVLEAPAGAAGVRWSTLRRQHTQAIRAGLIARGCAPATINHALAGLRGVLLEAERLGQLSADEAARARDLKPVKGARPPAGRALDAGERGALFGACDETTLGRRNAAVIAILYGCGLRRAELVGLDLADYQSSDGALTVRGKGNVERTVYVVDGARERLLAWLETRGADAGPLFYPVDRFGRIQRRRLSDAGVYAVVHRLSVRAGIEDATPHDFRRSCISDLLDAGADLSAAQQLAGHASVTTTTRYDRRGERAKRRAATLLYFPG